jgi:HD-like signal output (HDOD) protein
VRTLMLSAEIVSQLDDRAMKRFRVSGMWQHSLAVSRFVRVIARSERLDDDSTGHAVTAAMLHDAGRLVLASCLPDEYGTVVDRAARDAEPLAQVEQDVMGCTHAEVGAYLLGLWGLPDPVTVAVAWHHRPAGSGANTLGPLALVHAADTIASELLPERDEVVMPPDLEFLASLSTNGNYEEWKLACAARGDAGR